VNRAQRRRAKSKKKQGVRVTGRVGGTTPKFNGWQALENRTAVFNNKNMEEE